MTSRFAPWLPWFIVPLVALVLYLAFRPGSPAEVESADGVAESAGSSQPASASPSTTALHMPPAGMPELLSEWGQLTVADGQLSLGSRVTPYGLNSALFSDYAHKLRTVWMPPGQTAQYAPDEAFDFPVGSVITKTFYFPLDQPNGEDADPGGPLRVLKAAQPAADLATPLDLATMRLIETRVLVRRAGGWEAFPYVWNDEQTDATLERTGDLVNLTLVDGEAETTFPYVVPDANQCASCHNTNHARGEIQPIGPKARHLNTDVDYGEGVASQLATWDAAGLLAGLPAAGEVPRAAIWNDDSVSLDDRARAYLDINCAHCHSPVGPADTSGLSLEISTEPGAQLGVCKPPVAAGTGTGGRLVGIHPGDPDASIFVFRLESTDPGAMMPELGRAVVHEEGVDLISQWIESLKGSCP